MKKDMVLIFQVGSGISLSLVIRFKNLIKTFYFFINSMTKSFIKNQFDLLQKFLNSKNLQYKKLWMPQKYLIIVVQYCSSVHNQLFLKSIYDSERKNMFKVQKRIRGTTGLKIVYRSTNQI